MLYAVGATVNGNHFWMYSVCTVILSLLVPPSFFFVCVLDRGESAMLVPGCMSQ